MSFLRDSYSIMERSWDRFEWMLGLGIPGDTTATGNDKATTTEPPPDNNENNGKASHHQKNEHTHSSTELTYGFCVELFLRIVFSLSTGYLFHRLYHYVFFENNGGGGMLGGGTNSSDTGVYRRLQTILDKRHEQMQRNRNATSSSSGSSSAMSWLSLSTGGSRKRSLRGRGRQRHDTPPPPPRVPTLTSYERQMAQEIIDPDDIECSSFADIGGLDSTKREIYELAIMPLLRPDLFAGSKLVQPTKGILLYGKPGTGKTMLAKALAKESQALFLPLHLSKILNKWVGESNKLIAATFSLAHKLQPAIIFIDELDTFLKANNNETAYLDAIKAEFLTLWDGVTTSSLSRVLVLGATNKPQTIDPAILRRMPRAFHVPLPNKSGRLAILRMLLQHESVDAQVLDVYLPQLAKKTVGYSGSDLKELCKAAAMVGIQEQTHEFCTRMVMGSNDATTTKTLPLIKNGKSSSSETTTTSGLSSFLFPPPLLSSEKVKEEDDDDDEEEKSKRRPISVQDLELALAKVQKTGQAAFEYGQAAAAVDAPLPPPRRTNHSLYTDPPPTTTTTPARAPAQPTSSKEEPKKKNTTQELHGLAEMLRNLHTTTTAKKTASSESVSDGETTATTTTTSASTLTSSRMPLSDSAASGTTTGNAPPPKKKPIKAYVPTTTKKQPAVVKEEEDDDDPIPELVVEGSGAK